MSKPEKSSLYTDVRAWSKSCQVKSYPSISSKSSRKRVSPRKEFVEQNRLRLGFERKLRRQIQNSFEQAGKDAEKELKQAGRLIATDKNLNANLRRVLDNHYRAVIDAFGLRILRNQKQEPQFESIIRNYIRDFGAIRVTQITNTTMKQIRSIISQGAKDGEGVDVIGKNIRNSMNGAFSRYRANTIARTETHSAASYGNHAVNASLNIPNQKKRWVAVADLRTRSTHAQANGTEVNLDEDFIVGGVPMAYTGDPKGGAANVINCRCVTLYITPEDELSVDDEPPTQQVRGKLDIGDRLTIKSPKIRQQYNEKLNDNLSGLALAVALKLPKPDSIRRKKDGYYQRGTIISDLEDDTLLHEYGHHVDYKSSKTKKFRSESDKDFQQAFIDDATALGLGAKGLEMTDSILYEVNPSLTAEKLAKYRDRFSVKVEKERTIKKGRFKGITHRWNSNEPKYVGAGGLSDIIDAMTKGQLQDSLFVYGHGKKYYRGRGGSHYYETFANLYAIHGNKKAMAEARELFPNTVREFERMLREIESE